MKYVLTDWRARARRTVETNAEIERILMSVNSAVDNLIKRNVDFTAITVKEMMLGSANRQVYDAVGTDNDQSGRVDKRILGKDVEIVGKIALKCDYLLNILA